MVVISDAKIAIYVWMFCCTSVLILLNFYGLLVVFIELNPYLN